MFVRIQYKSDQNVALVTVFITLLFLHPYTLCNIQCTNLLLSVIICYHKYLYFHTYCLVHPFVVYSFFQSFSQLILTFRFSYFSAADINFVFSFLDVYASAYIQVICVTHSFFFKVIPPRCCLCCSMIQNNNIVFFNLPKHLTNLHGFSYFSSTVFCILCFVVLSSAADLDTFLLFLGTKICQHMNTQR